MEKDFLKVVKEHQDIIYKVCRMYRDAKEDQEDLFQEIVLQLWKSFPSFRNEAKISSWMYRIALNTAMAIFRKKKIDVSSHADLSNDPSWIEKENTSENEERMFEAIRMLSESERALIALYLEDYPYKEIAKITGISENYVGVRMSRIKTKLKNLIKAKQL